MGINGLGSSPSVQMALQGDGHRVMHGDNPRSGYLLLLLIDKQLRVVRKTCYHVATLRPTSAHNRCPERGVEAWPERVPMHEPYTQSALLARGKGAASVAEAPGLVSGESVKKQTAAKGDR